MAIKQVGHTTAGQSFTKGVTKRKFVVDTEADIAGLPESAPGSCAIVAAGGTVYMVNASGAWTKLGSSSDSVAAALAVAEGVLF